MPATDWACLMRTYTETTSGRDAPWIELAAGAHARRSWPRPRHIGPWKTPGRRLELLRILAHREAAEVR